MSQRESGYDRIEHDAYETPEWCTIALAAHLPEYVRTILEPACGSGKMVRPLRVIGYEVTGSDIQDGLSFFSTTSAAYDAIVTNPPYNLATEFVEHALHLMEPNHGAVAMLLRCDFDHAKTRKHLFAENAYFSKKLILTKRIKWIEGSTGSPSFNHAWYIWDCRYLGPPTIAYDFQ